MGLFKKHDESELIGEFGALFDSFIHSELYAQTVVDLLSTDSETELDTESICKVLFEDFEKYRNFLRAKYGIIDYETDMLILILTGFWKEHIPTLLVLTQAEAGKVRAALRRKLPFGLYWNINISFSCCHLLAQSAVICVQSCPDRPLPASRC